MRDRHHPSAGRAGSHPCRIARPSCIRAPRDRRPAEAFAASTARTNAIRSHAARDASRSAMLRGVIARRSIHSALRLAAAPCGARVEYPPTPAQAIAAPIPDCAEFIRGDVRDPARIVHRRRRRHASGRRDGMRFGRRRTAVRLRRPEKSLTFRMRIRRLAGSTQAGLGSRPADGASPTPAASAPHRMQCVSPAAGRRWKPIDDLRRLRRQSARAVAGLSSSQLQPRPRHHASEDASRPAARGPLLREE